MTVSTTVFWDDTVHFGSYVPNCQTNLLPPSHTVKTKAVCSSEILVLTSVRTSNLIYKPYLFLHQHEFYSQEVAGLIEYRPLHVRLNIHILAQNLGQRHFAYLCQLCLCESDSLVFIFIPEHDKETIQYNSLLRPEFHPKFSPHFIANTLYLHFKY